MFESLKLSTKLITGFCLISLIGLVISVISMIAMGNIDRYVNQFYHHDLISLSYIKDAETNRLEAGLRWRDCLISQSIEDKRKYADLVQQHIAKYKETLKKDQEILDNDQANDIFNEVNTLTEEWEMLTHQMVSIIVQENLSNITFDLNEIYKKQSVLSLLIDAKTNQLNQLKEKLAHNTINESNSTYHQNLILMITLVSFGFILSISVGLILSRYIMRQLGGDLKEVIEQVNYVSNGSFNRTISLNSQDKSSLLYSLKNVQATMNLFIVEQNLIRDKHVQGYISHKMDVNKFKGDYAQMASAINKLVQSHIDVKMHVVDIVTQYAHGDFSRDIDRLPAEKGKITEAIDSVKASLLAVNREIEIIAEAGAQGDFSKRSDTSCFKFMFKNMLVHLNELIETCDTGFNDVLRIANALAVGDLTQQITNEYPGTFGKTKDAVNGTVENLKALLIEIKESTDTINIAAQEIAAGNNDLSHRTEKQAASLEETASSMQELTSTVEANSDNAKQANEHAKLSSDIARKGVAVVNQVVLTMQEINESSRKIVDIITVIDGIAFQTNILALNAAVEAARAGEQGRGFAVVASEVRNLAQRAASAAGEIKVLISNSVDKVEDGTNLVGRAGDTMKEIVISIQGVTETISQITSASFEQNEGIQQVYHAISQMDDVTQQNAALVEQAAAAAESLEDQTRKLSISMSNFKMH